ncbi:MAG: ketopantoate reductase family protein [Granulosicoccus sp.]
MHVAILGAGAMGSWFGGQLALQGHDVQLLTTNQAHIDAVNTDGLVMQVHGTEQNRVATQLDARTPDQYKIGADLVIVLTKSYQTQAAMSAIAGNLQEHTAVLSLQNGLGNAETLSNHVRPENIWIGMSMMPVDRIAPGVVASRGTGRTLFGHCSDRNHPFANTIVKLFDGSGMTVLHDPDVHSRIWEKVAFNASMNALCALTHGTPGTIGQLAEAGALTHAVAREVAAVATANGVPIDLQAVFHTIAYACKNHGSHKASMLQDLLAGKRTEVDALNGAIVAMGKRHGIDTPLNATLATLVRLAELGEHTSPTVVS